MKSPVNLCTILFFFFFLSHVLKGNINTLGSLYLYDLVADSGVHALSFRSPVNCK